MVPLAPADALGAHAETVRDVAVDVIRTRHGYAAAAHQEAHTRSSRGYSTLWYDVLVDFQEAFEDRRFATHKLAPAGHRVPIINDCLVYVWRVPATGDPTHFANSPTRMSCFDARPELTLFGPNFKDDPISLGGGRPTSGDLKAVLDSVDDAMPVVLIRFESSPRQLQPINWAIAELDQERRKTIFHGEEILWRPELSSKAEVGYSESFDSGTPVVPTLEPKIQERPPFHA